MDGVTIELKQYKWEVEAKLQRDITWAEIHEATGLALTTINRLMNGKTQRIDLDTLSLLCDFFNVPPGPIPFIIYNPESNG